MFFKYIFPTLFDLNKMKASRKLFVSSMLTGAFVLSISFLVFIVTSLPVNSDTQTVYSYLANGMIAFHFFWIFLIFFGSWLASKWEWYKPINVAVIASTGIGQILYLGCPLVALEKAIRIKAGSVEYYQGSFICYWAKEWFGVNIPPGVLTVSLCVIFIAALAISFKGYQKELAGS